MNFFLSILSIFEARVTCVTTSLSDAAGAVVKIDLCLKTNQTNKSKFNQVKVHVTHNTFAHNIEIKIYCDKFFLQPLSSIDQGKAKGCS